MSSTTKKSTRGYIILALDFLLFLTLIKMLPFTPMENRGLALLVFIGILWAECLADQSGVCAFL